MKQVAELEVSQQTELTGNLKSLRVMVSRYSKKSGRKFTTLVVGDKLLVKRLSNELLQA